MVPYRIRYYLVSVSQSEYIDDPIYIQKVIKRMTRLYKPLCVICLRVNCLALIQIVVNRKNAVSFRNKLKPNDYRVKISFVLRRRILYCF